VQHILISLLQKMITVIECIVVTYFHKFTSDIAVPCVQQNKNLRKYKL